MNTGTIVLIVVVALVVLIGAYIGATYNKLVKSKNSVEEAFSTMDVYLKKRWDLIPNLVETVKGYAKHEKDTLAKIIELRNGNAGYDNLSVNDKVDVNSKLTSGISKIMALAEAYPELKANENFQNLSNQLTKIEEDIANARKYYNGAVRKMNNMVQMFPSNILASCFKFSTYKMFEVTDESQRENVQVKF